MCFLRNDKVISPELWLDNQPGIFLGLLLILISIVFFFVFFSKRKSSELHLLFLAIFVLGYGLRVISDNELVRMSLNIPKSFWEYVSSSATNTLPVFFILYLKSFSGWGWKRSIYWLLVLWIFYGLFAIIAGIVTGIPDFIGGTVLNNVMVILIVAVLSFNRFLTREKRSREGGIIETGIFAFILAVLYNNLGPEHFFLSRVAVEQTAFFFFLCCLIYASFLRSSRAEMEYLSLLHDLETARQIQRAILPQSMPVSSSYSIYPTYLPMTLLGGDFYDIHAVDDDHLGVLVADISGHGIPAALLASMVKVAFNAHVDLVDRPAALLESMNQALTGQLNNEFITAAYLWFDFRDMSCRHASAGHPLPILLRGSKAGEQPVAIKNIPIGVFPDIKYGESTVNLCPGDRIVLYTDGLTEVFNPRGELFGKNRLLTRLEELANVQGEKISDQIIQTVDAWSGKKKGASMDDDVTIIVIDISRL